MVAFLKSTDRYTEVTVYKNLKQKLPNFYSLHRNLKCFMNFMPFYIQINWFYTKLS
jgi:hypothetical protein